VSVVPQTCRFYGSWGKTSVDQQDVSTHKSKNRDWEHEVISAFMFNTVSLLTTTMAGVSAAT